MDRILYLVCLQILSFMLLGQVPNYNIAQYTLEDGLPSNECHDVVQDSSGYVWIATDRGLCRFDGYGFKTYGIKEGLEDISCLKLYKDHHQNIWISTFSKRIFIYIPNLDSIVPYEFNNLLEPYYQYTPILVDLYLDKNENLYLSAWNLGILKITKLGKLEIIDKQEDKAHNFSFEVEDKIFFGSSSYKKEEGKNFYYFKSGGYGNNIPFIHKNKKYSMAVDDNLENFQHSIIYNWSPDSLILMHNGYRHFWLGEIDPVIKLGQTVSDIIKLPAHQFITTDLYGQGVNYYENYSDLVANKYKSILPDVSATRVLYDQDENIFVTTLNKGLFYFKKTEISALNSLYDQNLRITGIESDKLNKLFFVTENSELFSLQLSAKLSSKLYTSKGILSDIKYVEDKKIIVGAEETSSFYIKDNKINKLLRRSTKKGLKQTVSLAGKRSYSFDEDNVIIQIENGFLKYKNLEGLEVYSSFESGLVTRKILSICDRNRAGTYLISCIDGLYTTDLKEIIKLDSIHPLFNSRINDIQRVGEYYYLGTQGYGLVKWDGKDAVQIINEHDGIVSNNIERLFVNDHQSIWLSTYRGISEVSWTSDNSYKIINYTTKHGLLANDVYDCTQVGEKMYIATGKGISVIDKEIQNYAPMQPKIEFVLVNGEMLGSNNLPKELKYNKNNISIHYKALDLKQQGDINYTYSINGDRWVESHSTEVNFTSLQPGAYNFAVKASNRDGDWSEALVYNFEIGFPWWRTTWFYLICVAILSIIGYLFYKNKINSLKEKNALQEERNTIQQEINSLERSALQAQMNPHFIFNCLNSIQNFIMANDKENAMSYLSRFAKLIRQNLSTSTEDTVPLDIEISMLKNYMELEKMRFNNSFDYRIDIDNSISLHEVNLPPMILQPYVENAILHGMKTMQGEGLVELIIKENDGFLHIEIKDNGGGIHKSENPDRKSFGMSITQKRLSHLNKLSDNNYDIKTLSDKTGTTISIVVELLS